MGQFDLARHGACRCYWLGKLDLWNQPRNRHAGAADHHLLALFQLLQQLGKMGLAWWTLANSMVAPGGLSLC